MSFPPLFNPGKVEIVSHYDSCTATYFSVDTTAVEAATEITAF